MLSRVREEAAQGQTEYGLLLILIAITLVVMLTLFGEQLSGIYEWIINQLPL